MVNKIKKILKPLLRILLGVAIFVVLCVGLSNLYLFFYAQPRTRHVDTASARPVAIVFGAGLTYDGKPSPVLRDRVRTASALYLNGKVKKLLMSGDNRFVDYNEPGAMRQYAIDLGIPAEDIVLDYAGRRTYDTCYRARYIFGVEEALLVTQDFHLARSIFLCDQLGVASEGVVAEHNAYHGTTNWIWGSREIPARMMAIWDVWVRRPLPVLGKPETIDPES